MFRKFTLFLAAAAAPLTLHAQEAPADDGEDGPKETTHIDLEQIVITGSPIARELGRTITAESVLSGEALAEALEATIGETLRREPGITSTFFGAGSSRPIIRGLGGDRIRVLEDGIGTFDAAQTSPDHAVPVEPALAQSIEVFRGPASLLYGSSASGGVVNTITGKIPSAIPEGGVRAAGRYSHSTVNNADEFAAGADVALGSIVIHGEGFTREADDFEIPGLNASGALIDALAAEAAENGEDFDPLEEFADGFVPNSDLRSDGGSAGVSWVLDGPIKGYVGFSGSVINSNYGVPEGILTEEDLEEEEEGEGEFGEEEEGEEAIRIDLEQVRFDFQGELRGFQGPVSGLRFRLGYGDYRHVELEGDEVGTLFENDEIEGRLELTGQTFDFLGGDVRTAFGVQGRFRDFSALGAEAFVPASNQRQLGVFALTEWTRGGLVLDLGGRYENVLNETDGFVLEEDGEEFSVDNDFNVLSVSGGVGYEFFDGLFFGVNGFRTERAPSLEENFSFGPHLATQSFEIGDADLQEEVARGFEATVRGEIGPITAIVNGFVTNYDDFIFEAETGEILDGLPVFQFTAADTTFRGVEAEVDVDFGGADLPGLGRTSFAGHAQMDYVRATSGDLDGNRNQPRIPPLSTLFGLSMTADKVSLRGEVEYVTAQDNIAAFELPTDSYVFVNAYLTFRPFTDRPNLAFDIRARNIGDEEGRVHSSFLKDTAPLPGRDIRFAVRLAY